MFWLPSVETVIGGGAESVGTFVFRNLLFFALSSSLLWASVDPRCLSDRTAGRQAEVISEPVVPRQSVPPPLVRGTPSDRFAAFFRAIPRQPGSWEDAHPGLFARIAEAIPDFTLEATLARARQLHEHPTVVQVYLAGVAMRRESAARLLEVARRLPRGSIERRVVSRVAEKMKVAETLVTRVASTHPRVRQVGNEHFDARMRTHMEIFELNDATVRGVSGEILSATLTPNIVRYGVHLSRFLPEVNLTGISPAAANREIDIISQVGSRHYVFSEVKHLRDPFILSGSSAASILLQARDVRALATEIQLHNPGAEIDRHMYFLSGIDRAAKAELESMGITVHGPVVN